MNFSLVRHFSIANVCNDMKYRIYLGYNVNFVVHIAYIKLEYFN